MIKMIDNELWNKLNSEIEQLSKEYARLKNKPKLYETERMKQARESQLRKDKDEKCEGFDSLNDFEKKRDYVLNLKKEVETLRLTERREILEQKLKDQTITEKELLELIALNRRVP